MENPYLPETLPEFDGEPFDFVVFGPHPDDIEHTMGGSLIKWSRAGRRALLCHLTRGESGTYGSPDLRQKEAAAAAQKLGAQHVMLNFEDTNIRDNYGARLALIEVVRAYRPQIVFAPYHHFPTMHPDHEATGQIARAVLRMARFKGIDSNAAPHWPRYLVYYLLPPDVRPTFVVDVSEVFDEFMEAARCYASQLDNIQNYFNRIMSLKKTHVATHPTADYVEAFYCEPPLDLADLDLLRL